MRSSTPICARCGRADERSRVRGSARDCRHNGGTAVPSRV
jgi:hypothetical protein